MRAALARAIIRTKPFLHPRLFSLVMRFAWLMLREQDGLFPAWYGAIQMRLDLRERADQEIFMHTYDPPLLSLVDSVCRPGDFVIDVGANAGVVSATAANAVGPTGLVAAFEPNASLTRRLEEMAKGCPSKNLRIFGCALGDRNADLPFYISSSHPYSSLDAHALPDYPIKCIANVAVHTLDWYFPDLAQGRHFRLLKIDAQGYENRIIRGAIKVFDDLPPDFVLLEAYLPGLDETVALLTLRGYQLFRLGSGAQLKICIKESIGSGENLVFSRICA